MLVRTAALHAPPAAPLLLMGTSDDERTSDPHAVATATAKAAAAAAADSAATVSAAAATLTSSLLRSCSLAVTVASQSKHACLVFHRLTRVFVPAATPHVTLTKPSSVTKQPRC